MSHPLSGHILVTTTVRGGKYSTTTIVDPVRMVSSCRCVGVERLGPTTNRDHDLADHPRPDTTGHPADLAHHLLVCHTASLGLVRRECRVRLHG